MKYTDILIIIQQDTLPVTPHTCIFPR